MAKRKKRALTIWDTVPDPGSINNKPSKTIPGEAMSIKDIIKRHSGGLIDPELERKEIWQDYQDHDSPDLEKFAQQDLVDKQIEVERIQEIELDKAVLKAEEEKQKNEAKNKDATPEEDDDEPSDKDTDSSSIKSKKGLSSANTQSRTEPVEEGDGV